MTAVPTVAILTNGNVFSAMALRRLMADLQRCCNFSVVITTGLRKPQGNRAKEAASLFARWGTRYTLYKVATSFLPSLLDRVRLTSMTVASACEALGVPMTALRNVNNPEGLTYLRSLRPDLLISYSCPYKIGNEVLSIPAIGSLNVHSSLLPMYAGVCTYVHVLSDGAAVTGVTVHEMVERFDAGKIVLQRELAIPPGVSVAELFTHQSLLAGDLLVEAVEFILSTRRINGIEQDLTKRTYRSEPRRSDIQRLRGKGHRLIRLGDVKRISASIRG